MDLYSREAARLGWSVARSMPRYVTGERNCQRRSGPWVPHNALPRGAGRERARGCFRPFASKHLHQQSPDALLLPASFQAPAACYLSTKTSPETCRVPSPPGHPHPMSDDKVVLHPGGAAATHPPTVSRPSSMPARMMRTAISPLQGRARPEEEREAVEEGMGRESSRQGPERGKRSSRQAGEGAHTGRQVSHSICSAVTGSACPRQRTPRSARI